MSETKVIHVHDMSNYPDAVYIGRAMPRRGLKASPFANPYKIGRDGSREDVLRKFASDLDAMLAGSGRQGVLDDLCELIGKPLACWCRHDGQPITDETGCHGDILIAELRANYTDAELRRLAALT